MYTMRFITALKGHLRKVEVREDDVRVHLGNGEVAGGKWDGKHVYDFKRTPGWCSTVFVELDAALNALELDRFYDEAVRVFGESAVVEPCASPHQARLTLPDLPERVRFDVHSALKVLARFQDGAGRDVYGEKLVLATLKDRGATCPH